MPDFNDRSLGYWINRQVRAYESALKTLEVTMSAAGKEPASEVANAMALAGLQVQQARIAQGERILIMQEKILGELQGVRELLISIEGNTR